ncbi:RHS repeat-associated core domain-containing protein [Candidatus Aenigmatarchaeota archaeon]
MRKIITILLMLTIFTSLIISSVSAQFYSDKYIDDTLERKFLFDEYVITEDVLPFLDGNKVYLVGGYVIKDKTKTYFSVEINKIEGVMDILCTHKTTVRDDGVYCYDVVVKETDPETQQTHQTKNTFIIMGVSEIVAQQEPLQRQGRQPMAQRTFIEDGYTLYVYGVGLVAKSNDEGITYYHQDHLSSNRFSTNTEGELTSKSVQYPYGSDFSDAGTKEADTSYKFTGQEQDSDLYYYGARYYEPTTARFISADPVFNPSVSPYAYAANNPLRYTDPTGEYVVDKLSYSIVPGVTKQKIKYFVETAKTLSPAVNSVMGSYGHTYPSILVNPTRLRKIYAQASYNPDPGFSVFTGTGGQPFYDHLLNDVIHRNSPEGRVTLSGVSTFDELAGFVHESTHRLQHVENRLLTLNKRSVANVYNSLFGANGFFHTHNPKIISGLSVSELGIARQAVAFEIEAQQEAYNTLVKIQGMNPTNRPALSGSLTDALNEHSAILSRMNSIKNEIDTAAKAKTSTTP